MLKKYILIFLLAGNQISGIASTDKKGPAKQESSVNQKALIGSLAIIGTGVFIKIAPMFLPTKANGAIRAAANSTYSLLKATYQTVTSSRACDVTLYMWLILQGQNTQK